MENTQLRTRNRTMSKWVGLVAAIAATMFFAVTPAQAAPADPPPVPEGVQVAASALYRVDDQGTIIGSGPVSPGRTFFAVYRVTNLSDEPVTVVGFEPNFWFTMHPSRQADYPDGHCNQFFETRTFESRERTQTYPQEVLPGESIEIADNTTYHYIYGPVSNECQSGSMSFGGPIFFSAETVTPEAPTWTGATCDAAASVVIPDTNGVTYSMNGEVVEAGEHVIETVGDVVVTAQPLDDGYVFADDTVTEWVFTAVAPECEDETDDGGDGTETGDGDADGTDGDADGTGTDGDADGTASDADGTGGDSATDELATTGLASNAGRLAALLAATALMVFGGAILARRQLSRMG